MELTCDAKVRNAKDQEGGAFLGTLGKVLAWRRRERRGPTLASRGDRGPELSDVP